METKLALAFEETHQSMRLIDVSKECGQRQSHSFRQSHFPLSSNDENGRFTKPLKRNVCHPPLSVFPALCPQSLNFEDEGNTESLLVRLLDAYLFVRSWLDWSILSWSMALVNFWIVERWRWLPTRTSGSGPGFRSLSRFHPGPGRAWSVDDRGGGRCGPEALRTPVGDAIE